MVSVEKNEKLADKLGFSFMSNLTRRLIIIRIMYSKLLLVSVRYNLLDGSVQTQ